MLVASVLERGNEKVSDGFVQLLLALSVKGVDFLALVQRVLTVVLQREAVSQSGNAAMGQNSSTCISFSSFSSSLPWRLFLDQFLHECWECFSGDNGILACVFAL